MYFDASPVSTSHPAVLQATGDDGWAGVACDLLAVAAAFPGSLCCLGLSSLRRFLISNPALASGACCSSSPPQQMGVVVVVVVAATTTTCGSVDCSAIKPATADLHCC